MGEAARDSCILGASLRLEQQRAEKGVNVSDLIRAVALAGVLVAVEILGSVVARWVVLRRVADRDLYPALVPFILAFDKAGLPPAEVPSALVRLLQDKSIEERRKKMSGVVAAVVPGPELCYLAATLEGTLFLALNYDPSNASELCPVLAGSLGALPIVVGAAFLSLAAWLGLTIWREAIVSDVLVKRRLWGIALIGIVGGGVLSACMYLLCAGRIS